MPKPRNIALLGSRRSGPDMMAPVALGFRAIPGGSVVVGVAMDGRAPRLVLSTFLATAEEGDRLSYEPYHVAAEKARGGKVTAQAVAAVAEGRKRQDRLAAKELDLIVRRLGEEKCKVVAAALLVNRAGWITDLLEHSLSAPEHPPVAEGLAVRDALRFAFKQCRVKAVEMDEKTLPQIAARALRLTEAALALRLKEMGAAAGKPWRKEQKLACLAAWLAIATLRRKRPRPVTKDSGFPLSRE
jgi:hypothetical protein